MACTLTCADMLWWQTHQRLQHALKLALNAEEAEGGTKMAVIHALHDTLPPIFQEREAVENLTKGLADLQLLAKAKERGKYFGRKIQDLSGKRQPLRGDEEVHGMDHRGQTSGVNRWRGREADQ